MSYSNQKNNTIAIIPCFNEKETINSVVEQTIKFVDKIILVDDGSTDNSINNKLKFKDIVLLKHNENRGKGEALRTGFQYALKSNYNYIITLDADLQHPPSLIPELLNLITKYDIVIGNRLSNLKDMPIQRRLSNLITSYLISVKTKCKISDSQSGFRLFKKDILFKILPEEKGFEAESEMLIRAGKLGLKIGFTPIPTIYNNSVSKIKPFETIFGFLKVLFKY